MNTTDTKPASRWRTGLSARQLAELKAEALTIMQRSLVSLDTLTRRLKRADPNAEPPLDVQWIKKDIETWRKR